MEPLFFDFSISDNFLLLLLSGSFLLCGLICLLCRRHVIYLCAVAMDMLIWPVFGIVMGSPFVGVSGGLTLIPFLLAHLALLLYTLIGWRRLTLPTPWKILITVLLCLILAVSAVGSLSITDVTVDTAENISTVPFFTGK